MNRDTQLIWEAATYYKNDTIKEYSNVYQETERYINFNDYNKYLKKINQLTSQTTVI
jgi:hypothetical protein